MSRMLLSLLSTLALITASPALAIDVAAGAKDWAINMSTIEACSCPMFCQCYFNTMPAMHEGHEGHAMEHFCKANNAYKVNRGHWGATKLDGVKVWMSGDLGGDFSSGVMDWGVLTFDPSTTADQKAAMQMIFGYLFPVKWKSFNVAADLPIEWTATKDHAVAKLDGGKAGEVVLNRFQGMSNEPVVIHNLKYWGAPRNDGFVLMPNEVEAYRIGDKPYEFKGTNGFMITVDMNSKDVMASAK
jgi:hypothetical protein